MMLGIMLHKRALALVSRATSFTDTQRTPSPAALQQIMPALVLLLLSFLPPAVLLSRDLPQAARLQTRKSKFNLSLSFPCSFLVSF